MKGSGCEQRERERTREVELHSKSRLIGEERVDGGFKKKKVV